MSLTKSEVAIARKELEAAFRTVAAKIGIDFSIGIIRFGENEMRCKIEGIKRSVGQAPSKIVNTKDAALSANDWRLGATFDSTKTYHSPSLGRVKIVGFARQAKKYPFIVTTMAGKRYKITTQSAQAIVKAGAVA